MTPKTNNRKSQRHSCFVPIEAHKNSAFGISQTLDISQGGLGLVLTKAIPVGHKIGVEIQLDSDQKSVVAMGEVKWIQKMQDSKHYRAGICFEKAKPLFRNRLEEALSI